MASNGSEPTLKDVMDMLHTINNKVRHDHPESSPAKRFKKTRELDNLPLAPLSGSWASTDVIERVMFSRDQLQKRVKEMATEISRDYKDSKEDSFTIIGLMSGAYMFMADLTREIQCPHEIDFVTVSSYGLETISSANVKIKKDLDKPIEGKDVLIVDEMCDTGRTMACLKQLIIDRGARSVKVCVLLDKYERREADVHLDYVGWKCEDQFLVGYGMDWSHRFRSLPDIAVVRRAAYAKDPAH